MYQTFIFYHFIIRWLVLASLLYSIFRAAKGYVSNAIFSKTDNTVRHWTATIAHIQLIIGIILYTQSPIIKYFWNNFHQAVKNFDSLFFGLIHITLMLTAIVFITISSALAKRQAADKAKFRTLLIWYSIALIIIFIAIPWPFSHHAHRPFLK